MEFIFLEHHINSPYNLITASWPAILIWVAGDVVDIRVEDIVCVNSSVMGIW
jgi:hypothetical protein